MSKRRTGKIKRRRPKKEPKRRFILFCEGKNTEPAYFSAIKNALDGALISIKTRPGVGVPITIAKEALKFASHEGLSKSSRRRRNLFEEKDEVWAVFDRDEHDRFDEAVNLCESNGIGVARSNPCFEVWLILHDRDYDRPDDRHEVQRVLERLRPEYDRGGRKIPNCREMVVRVVEAERRGKILLQRRLKEWTPHGRPSTTVGELTRAIREAERLAKKGQ